MEGFCLSETKRDRPVLFSEIVDDYVQFQNAHNRPPHNDWAAHPVLERSLAGLPCGSDLSPGCGAGKARAVGAP